MKTGILGGSFNPPHIGHLILAEYVRDTLCLDKVIFVPCAVPPHKRKTRLLAGSLRLKMLKSALAGNKRFGVSDLEIKRGGVSYTIDTLLCIKKQHPDWQLFLIVGLDLYEHFSSWKDYKNILALSRLIVVNRHLGFQISRTGRPKSRQRNIVFLNMPAINISSSLIRSLRSKGRSIKYLVPEKIEDYILKNNIYEEVS